MATEDTQPIDPQTLPDCTGCTDPDPLGGTHQCETKQHPGKTIEENAKLGNVKLPENASTGPKDIDWTKAKEYYLSGKNVTLNKVAKKFGVSLQMVGRIASRESWKKVRMELKDKAHDQFLQNYVQNVSKINRSHADAWRRIKKLTLEHLTPKKDKDGKPLPVPLSRLQKISFILRTAIEGERITVNLPTSIAKSEVDHSFKDQGPISKAVQEIISTNGSDNPKQPEGDSPAGA